MHIGAFFRIQSDMPGMFAPGQLGLQAWMFALKFFPVVARMVRVSVS